MGRKKRKKPRGLDYTIYTDGGCESNPGGKGGYGVIIVNNKTADIKTLSGGFKHTTNNRMEIKAVIEGLTLVPRDSRCLVVSDSQLVVNCLSGLWERNKNLDLWDSLDKVSKGISIRTKWVRGHNGDILNEMCDLLANKAMEGILSEDAGYTGRKKKKGAEINGEIKVPEVLGENVLDYIPPIDESLTNKEGRDNIAFFYKKGTKTFKDYTSLKTGGLDGWSKMSISELIKYDKYGNDAWRVIEENLEGGSAKVSALKWFRRGLSLEDAIRKAKVDLEVNKNVRSKEEPERA